MPVIQRIDAPAALEVDVVVVGAGIAGLVTARRLEEAGISVAVLEAKARTGGRTINYPLEGWPGKVVEGGGQWIGPTQHRVLALMDELGLAQFKTHMAGSSVMLWQGECAQFEGDIPPFTPDEMADVLGAVQRLDALATTVPLDEPWQTPDADILDQRTLADWMDEHVTTSRIRQFLDVVFAIALGAQGQTVSLLHILNAINSSGGMLELNRTEGGPQDARVVGGSQMLSIRLAENLTGPVFVDQPVKSIEQHSAGVLVCSGIEVRARRAVISTRPDDCAAIAMSPLRTEARAEMERRWGAATGRKLMMVYDQPFWREQGLSGFCVTDSPWAPMTFDNSPLDGEPGVLLTFVIEHLIAKYDAEHVPDLRDDQRRRAHVLEALTKCFGPEASRPTAFVEHDWGNEDYTSGCLSPRPAGLITAVRGAGREPLGRVHFAGAETSDVWMGTMDGAVRSGERAATEVLNSLDDESVSNASSLDSKDE
jgi:monoamine oxidase